MYSLSLCALLKRPAHDLHAVHIFCGTLVAFCVSGFLSPVREIGTPAKRLPEKVRGKAIRMLYVFLGLTHWEGIEELAREMVPKRIFLTKGVGKHKERLTSFELALRDAGIAAQNLVRVSSIFPPQCKIIPRVQGLKHLYPGEVVFAVVAENSTREPHRLLASSIGLAVPADRNTYGYLSEHHSFGETEDSAGDYAEELAAEMLATTLNVEFDPNKSWDEKKQIYHLSNKIVRTMNITQSAVGDKRGLWTTVIAAAIMLFD